MKTSDVLHDDLESGFLLRLRTWRDALPVLSIVDALRPASSVIAWLIVAVPLIISSLCTELFAKYFGTWEAWDIRKTSDVDTASALSLFETYGLFDIFSPAIRFYSAEGRASSGIVLLTLQIGLVFLWALPAGFIMRQSALAISGRLSMSTRECLAFVVRRIPAMINAVVIPLFVIALLFLVSYVSLVSARVPVVGWWLSSTLQFLSLPLVIAGGVIGAGSLVAVPLAWAAIAIEEDGSSFSAISRGYEYLLRRPLQLFLLLFLCCGATTLLVGLTSWVSTFLSLILSRVADLSAAEQVPGVYDTVIEYFPKIIALVAFWSLIAWVYLMLRRSANGQEIEDVWEPKNEKPGQLPTLEI